MNALNFVRIAILSSSLENGTALYPAFNATLYSSLVRIPANHAAAASISIAAYEIHSDGANAG
jgi:hypothetical protein